MAYLPPSGVLGSFDVAGVPAAALLPTAAKVKTVIATRNLTGLCSPRALFIGIALLAKRMSSTFQECGSNQPRRAGLTGDEQQVNVWTILKRSGRCCTLKTLFRDRPLCL